MTTQNSRGHNDANRCNLRADVSADRADDQTQRHALVRRTPRCTKQFGSALGLATGVSVAGNELAGSEPPVASRPLAAVAAVSVDDELAV